MQSLINDERGFTLIELMIVIAIIGILVAIALPSYERYVIKSKRTDMMSEMHNIASQIESRKLAQGKYSDDLKSGLIGNYPQQGTVLYNVTVETIVAPVSPPPDTPPPLGPLTSKWIITATPKANSQVSSDGKLTLNYQNIKCRGSICGTGKEWND